MTVWLHSNAEKLYALTADEKGASLPSDLGPWEALRSLSISDEAEDEAEALMLIQEHGYCCFK
ncbi:hypothetical protein [Sphingomonas sp. IC4-52]|uniref:hypothetical protein n=1 Tax=Sphingomonas sp. IC4-52 TaxID=2887202 RepID=UPI001D1101D8|nr:hypothetical protein [Sphingomonas sp. IC4-52]MCC2979046.1 hypothetical protein [Sphingomonas sp. IC4-52]